MDNARAYAHSLADQLHAGVVNDHLLKLDAGEALGHLAAGLQAKKTSKEGHEGINTTCVDVQCKQRVSTCHLIGGMWSGMGCCIERLSRRLRNLMLLLLCCLAKHTDRICITPKYQNSIKAESQERSQNVWQVKLGSSISSHAPDMI